MTEEIVCFTLNPESPCARAARKRACIRIVAPSEDPGDQLGAAKTAIIDVDGEERQRVLKALLKAKLPFALCGLCGETPESLKRLCAAAKRRHLQICWLGSLRFEWAMARLKETISAGVLGAMQQVRLSKPSNLGMFGRIRDEDLLGWLILNNEAAVTYEDSPDGSFKVIAIGTHGTATALLRTDGYNEFAVALQDEQPRAMVAPSAPWEAEIGYLLFAMHSSRPWTMLGRVPN